MGTGYGYRVEYYTPPFTYIAFNLIYVAVMIAVWVGWIWVVDIGMGVCGYGCGYSGWMFS